MAAAISTAKEIPYGNMQGDGMQLGATFVVAKGGLAASLCGLKHARRRIGMTLSTC